MFKDFENIQKDQANPTAGLGGAGGADDEGFMKLLNTFAKDLLSGDKDNSDKAMDNIMN